jgi:hypothetical protein
MKQATLHQLLQILKRPPDTVVLHLRCRRTLNRSNWHPSGICRPNWINSKLPTNSKDSKQDVTILSPAPRLNTLSLSPSARHLQQVSIAILNWRCTLPHQEGVLARDWRGIATTCNFTGIPPSDLDIELRPILENPSSSLFLS